MSCAPLRNPCIVICGDGRPMRPCGEAYWHDFGDHILCLVLGHVFEDPGRASHQRAKFRIVPGHGPKPFGKLIHSGPTPQFRFHRYLSLRASLHLRTLENRAARRKTGISRTNFPVSVFSGDWHAAACGYDRARQEEDFGHV